MAYPYCLSNLKWTGVVFCLPDLLVSTAFAVSLESLSLGFWALDMNYFGGDSLVNGSLMAVGSGLGIYLRSCYPGS